MVKGFGKFFKPPRHRVFDYKPLYFDKEKEEIINEVKKKQFFDGLTEEELQAEYHKTKVKLRFEQKRAGRIAENKGSLRSNTGFRVIIIAAVIAVIFYYTIMYV